VSTQLSVSIALATYNGERYIGEQLDSIASQTRLPDELVISDDASTDSTLDIVSKFARRVPFPVRVHINPERLGSTRNFEVAIRACKGDIIFLCDQDDVWYPEKIALIEERFVDNIEIGAVFTDADLVDQDMRPYKKGARLWEALTLSFQYMRPYRRGTRLWESLGFSELVAARNSYALLLKHFAATGATMAFRSKHLDLLLPIPKEWLHDAWIALLISATSGLTMISRPTIAYRQHSSNQYGAPRRRKDNQGKRIAEIFTPQAILYNEAFLRLCEFSERNRNIEIDPQIHSLKEKVDFLYARAALPNKRWRRLPQALYYLITLNYHHYGRGWTHFINNLARDE